MADRYPRFMEPTELNALIDKIIPGNTRYEIHQGIAGVWKRNLEAHLRFHHLGPDSIGCHLTNRGQSGQILIIDKGMFCEIEYQLKDGNYDFSSTVFPVSNVRAIHVTEESVIGNLYDVGNIFQPSLRLQFGDNIIEIDATRATSEASDVLNEIITALRKGMRNEN